MLRYIREGMTYVGLLLLGVWAMWSLFTPDLFTGHDVEAHITRIIEFHTAVQDGQIPPRWGSGFFGGIGSPVLILNYQLPYIVSEILVQLHVSYIDSFKATLALGFLLSIGAAYWSFRSIFGWKGGILATFLYCWAPYRFVDIYVRAAYGEAFSFIFPPIILYGIHKKKMLPLILGFAGLTLSHPVASALFTLFFTVYACVAYVIQKDWASVRLFFAAFGIGVLISAYNVLPTLLETRYTKYSPEISSPLDHFPTFSQLIRSKWGYGISTPDDKDEMSFRIGYAQLSLAILACIVLTVKLSTTQKKNTLIQPLVVLFSFILVFFLMQDVSKPLWVAFKMNYILDFPWRMLMIVVFFTAYLGGWLVSIAKIPYDTVLLIVFALFSLRSNINHMRINAIWPFSIDHYLEFRGTGDAYGEFASARRLTTRGSSFPQRVEVFHQQSKAIMLKSTSDTVEAIIETEKPAEVRFNIMYFPGWRFWINRKEHNVPEDCDITSLVPGTNEIDETGLVLCPIPAGKSHVRAHLTLTAPQFTGILLSLAGIGLTVWIPFQSFFPRTMKRKQSSRSSKK